VWMMQLRHTCFQGSVLSWWGFCGGLIMKCFMSVLAVAVLISTPVWAANRGANQSPNRTANAPLAPQAPAWTGCYVDAGAGYGLFNQKQHTETFPGLAPTTAGDFEEAAAGLVGWVPVAIIS
jgi:hypothetical protein